jgi:AcrR family transcriptional regulator
MFSEKGYELVTVAEIADAVGIKAPSLYKHFKSKQDIYEAIIIEMDSRYKNHMDAMRMDGKEAEKDREYYATIDEDELVRFGLALFKHFLHDEYAGKFRRMLTITQVTNKDLSDVFVTRYFNDPLTYQGKSFAMLSEAGKLAPEDPRIMALHYYAPIFLLLSICDRHPEFEQEAIKMKEQHIRQFIRVYGNIPK